MIHFKFATFATISCGKFCQKFASAQTSIVQTLLNITCDALSQPYTVNIYIDNIASILQINKSIKTTTLPRFHGLTGDPGNRIE